MLIVFCAQQQRKNMFAHTVAATRFRGYYVSEQQQQNIDVDVRQHTDSQYIYLNNEHRFNQKHKIGPHTRLR